MSRLPTAVLLLACSAAPMVLATETPAATPAPTPPASYMAPYKHIGLSDDDSIWVGLGGEVRERYEYWNNFNTGRTEGDFLMSRVRASADLYVGENLRFFVEGKSCFATDRGGLPGGVRTLDVDEIDLQQGYAEFTLPTTDGLQSSVKAGRMGLNFGKQRLVSTLPWSNTMRAWDGVDATLKYEGWQADAFYTHFVPVQKYDFNTADGQIQFYGAYVTGPLAGPKLKADFYYLGLDQQPTTLPTWNGTPGPHEERHTVGSRLFGKDKASGFDYDLEGAHQFGRIGKADINAFMVASELGWNAQDAMSTRIYVGADYASGDKSAGGDVNTFNQLYPLGHAFAGQADLMGRQNQIDLVLGTSVKPHKDVTLTGEAHKLMRADKGDAIYNKAGAVATAPGLLTGNREVGVELDFKANWKVNTYITLEAGYSHIFCGRGYETGSRAVGNDVDFAYTQASFSF